MTLQALLLPAAAVVLLLLYLARLRWFPTTRCRGEWSRRLLALVLEVDPACKGGRYFAGNGRDSRLCRRCGGDGHVIRFGRRIVNGLKREAGSR